MRRRWLILPLVGIAGAAWAGWGTAQSVTGVPVDVDVADAGSPEWVGVASSGGGFGFVNGALVSSVTAGGAAMGVAFDPTHSCLGAVASANPCTVTWPASCASNTPRVAGGSANLVCERVRQSGVTSVVASYDSNPSQQYLSYSPQTGPTAWGSISSVILSYTAVAPVTATTQASGAVQGVFFAQNAGNGSLLLCPLTLANCQGWPSSSYVWAAPYDWMTDLEFLGSADAGEWVLFVSDGGLAMSDGGTPTALGLPTGVTQVKGLSFEEGTDPAMGSGFGMLAVDTATGSEILSAVPDPAVPGRVWIPSTAQPTFSGTLGHVRCLAGRVCGAVTSSPGTNNVLIYRNASPPDLTAIPASMALDGGLQTVFFDAGDPDGDAVFLTWRLDGGTAPPTFNVLLSNDPQGRVIQIDPGSVSCGSAPTFAYAVTATDGLHESTRAVSFTTTGSGGGLPVLSDAGVVHLQAGGSPQSVTVTAGNICPLGVLSVSPATGAPVPLTPMVAGNTLVVTPPVDWCDPANKVDTFVVQSDGGGSATLTVQVDPWGLPLPPFTQPTGVSQDAGTTALYGPAQTHVCADAGARVMTFWSWDAGPTFTASVNGSLLSVTLDDCEDAGVVFTAYNQTSNDALMASSTTSTLTVFPTLSFSSLVGEVPTVFPGTEVSGAGGLYLDAGLEIAARCPAFRGLEAAVTLIVDGGAYATATAPVAASGNAAVTLPFPANCNGVEYSLSAVVQGGGATSLVGAPGPFLAPALDAGIATVAATAPLAECGGPATGGAMTATPATGVGVCPFPSWSWTQAGGPPVTLMSATTDAVTFETVGTGLSLVGQTVTLTATATVGSNNAQVTTPVVIGVQPFVNVQHAIQTAQPEALSLFGVAVTLVNATACDVSGVAFDEYPDQMEAIPGSARVSGAPVDTGSDPTHLAFSGITLPGAVNGQAQPVTLTYAARPMMLVGPAPHGHASLNDIPISGDTGLSPEPKGCGCTEASALELAALWVCAVALARRRRALRNRS